MEKRLSGKEYEEFLAWKKAKEAATTKSTESTMWPGLSAKTEKGEMLTVEQFVIRAIDKLKKPGYAGINAVYSGFNSALSKAFPTLKPKDITGAMIEKGLLEGRGVKKATNSDGVKAEHGSFMIYKKGQMPAGYGWDKRGDDVLKSILA